MKMHTISFLLALCLVYSTAAAEAPQTPLEQCGFKKVTSHADLLAYINALARVSPRLTIATVGTTVEGRTIPSVHVLPRGAGEKIKVFLYCQQHGNEPSGKEAVLMLLKTIAADKKNTLFPNIDLTIMPSVNPDGNEAGKRQNAHKQDLNRDHLMCSEPETRAVHAVFAALQPEAALDVHEFMAYRKEMLAEGCVRTVDEQVGAPTNLNVSAAIREYGLKRMFPFLESELSEKNLHFSNYLKLDEPSDTVRASTTSINDGRQSLAILNTYSFILEGKNGHSLNDDLQRRTEGQLVAIEAFLGFVNANSTEIRSLVLSERKTMEQSREPVIVQMDYRYAGETIALPMEIVASGADTTVSKKYASLVTSLATVSRPIAYLIPQGQTALIAALDRLGIRGERIVRSEKKNAEIISITDTKQVWMENKSFTDIQTQVREGNVTAAAGDLLVPVAQTSSALIVIALEPASMWGLAQYAEFSALRSKGTDYPVYRIMK